jgi:hypothetical protein
MQIEAGGGGRSEMQTKAGGGGRSEMQTEAGGGGRSEMQRGMGKVAGARCRGEWGRRPEQSESKRQQRSSGARARSG